MTEGIEEGLVIPSPALEPSPAPEPGRDDVAQEPWPRLLAAARQAAEHAYVPYSHYRVGAAALTADGRLITGCNVENASYGLTLCAECALVSALAMTGGGYLVAFCCVFGSGELTTPCGRCRQLLWEHGGPELAVLTPAGIKPLGELLPQAWGFSD